MSRAAFLERNSSPSNSLSHARAVKQEKELAKRTKGRVTLASGAKNIKGDVRIYKIARIEAKTTRHKSFNVTRAMIEQLEDAALPAGEVPIIVVEFLDRYGQPISEVAVVPTYVLDKLTS
jgi:hypothetical protein